MAEWIKKTDDFCYWYVCPHCGEETPYNKYGNWYFSRYCPNCGKPLDYPDMEDDD